MHVHVKREFDAGVSYVRTTVRKLCEACNNVLLTLR